MFEEYKKRLNKTENKQFERVLGLYPKLRPRYYNQVKAKIVEDKKISLKTQEKMLEFNDYIFESFFASLGFIKEAGGFKIGDEVFADDKDETKIISEFIVRGKDVFVVFEGFHPLGLDVRCFQNHAHGPGTSLDSIENGEQILIHNSATLTINGTIDTEDYEEYKQLFIDAFEQLTKVYPVFRLNLITMWEGCQDAIIYDSVNRNKIITVPLTRND